MLPWSVDRTVSTFDIFLSCHPWCLDSRTEEPSLFTFVNCEYRVRAPIVIARCPIEKVWVAKNPVLLSRHLILLKAENTDFTHPPPTNSILPIESDKSHLPPSASSIGCLPIRMTDAPPQLEHIHQSSGFSVPTLQSNMDNNTTNGNIQNAKDTIYNSQVCLNVERFCETGANNLPFQYSMSSRDHQPTY